MVPDCGRVSPTVIVVHGVAGGGILGAAGVGHKRPVCSVGEATEVSERE